MELHTHLDTQVSGSKITSRLEGLLARGHFLSLLGVIGHRSAKEWAYRFFGAAVADHIASA